MRVFTATGVEGSTACFRKFLTAVDSHNVDVGVLLGDLTGRKVVSVIKKGASSWEVPMDRKVHEFSSAAALAEMTAAIEDHGDYWIEQSPEELERTKSDPMLVELLFKALVRDRMERWLDLADRLLGREGQQVFVAPGCGDWTIIDDLLEQSDRMSPCDNRVVDIDGYQMMTTSLSGPTEWGLAREVDDHQLHQKLLDLCGTIGDPDYAIFNLQADSRAAQRVVKRFQPLVRILGSVQGASGGARKRGRTLELIPRCELIEDADRALHGVLIELEQGSVKDYAFADV